MSAAPVEGSRHDEVAVAPAGAVTVNTPSTRSATLTPTFEEPAQLTGLFPVAMSPESGASGALGSKEALGAAAMTHESPLVDGGVDATGNNLNISGGMQMGVIVPFTDHGSTPAEASVNLDVIATIPPS